MSVSREEMQEELDAILANAEERVAILKAGEDREKFLEDPVNEFGHGVTLGISQTAGVPVDIVNTIANAVGLQTDAPIGSGDNIQDVLEEFGNIPEGIEEEAQGVVGGAGEGIGVAAVMTPAMLAPFIKKAMDPNFEINQAKDIGRFQGVGEPDAPSRIPRSRAARMAFTLKQMGENIARTAVKNPKTFAVSEIVGAGTAGAAVEYAKRQDAGAGVQSMAGLGAGVAGGLTPTAIPRATRNMYRWGMRNLLPFTKAGSEARAATQMQARSGDPVADAEAALNAPDGITPARATGNERLMAQEARVLEDDAVLDLEVREDLKEAVRRSEMELRSLYDTPRGRESWEQSIFQRVAPEGVEIRPGTSEEMLDQLFDEFRPLYAEFRGYPIMPNLFGVRSTTLETMIKNAPQSNRVQASEETRKAVARRLNSLFSGFSGKVKPNEDGIRVADSSAYLKLRQDIRAEARKRAKMNDQESVSLYKIAEEKINQVLKSQLEPEVLADLGLVDSHYRNYKVTEDAVYRGSGTDKGLTPEGLLQALRDSRSSKGAYARGEQLELRSAAVSGKSIAKMMNDPTQIRRNVARMSADDIANSQNDFLDTIMKMSIDPSDLNERVSGVRLRTLMNKYSDASDALRIDEDTMGRMTAIADELVLAEKSSPAAVSQLYEDGPSNILQLLATIVGAQRGQAVASKGVGSSMVLAGYFANKARSILSKFTTDEALVLLTRAQTDKKLFAYLLTKPDIAAAKQTEAVNYLRSYLAVAVRPSVEDAGEYYGEELERLRRQTRDLGTNF